MTDKFRVGSRVHTGFGAYVEKRDTGTVIDTPGTLRVLVFWDNNAIGGGKGPNLMNLSSLRNAEEPCGSCGGVRTHKDDCAIRKAAFAGHQFVERGIRTGRTCRVCDQTESHRNHPSGAS